MHYTCPECKNTVDTSSQTMMEGQVTECPMCGISLLVLKKNNDTLVVEVTDEGK